MNPRAPVPHCAPPRRRSRPGSAARRPAWTLAVPLAALFVLTPFRGVAAQEVSLALGTPAPDVALEDLEGNPVRLADYLDGGPALIEFWASWCENCEALQPQLDEIQARFGARLNVVAIAVAVAQSQRRVRRHLERHDPGYPFLWDAGGDAVRAYEAATTSIVVLVDAEGRVAYTGVGGGQDLIPRVEALFEGSR